jgi:hypothetical protein
MTPVSSLKDQSSPSTQSATILRRFLSSLLPFVCVVAVLCGLLLKRQFGTDLGHDQVSYIFEAQRFLSGAEPYGPHLAETNPPVIIWFSAIPVLLAHALPISPEVLFRCLILAMLLGSTAWSITILRRGWTNAVFDNGVGLGLFACAILVAGFATGGYEFGQREHLLVLLVVPYILAVGSGTASTLWLAERCALGVAAGLAVWFKPHDILILIAVELLLAVNSRSLRRILAPEFVAFVLSTASIFALVLVATPLYCKQTLPLLFDTYWALGTSTTLALALTQKIYLVSVVAALVGFLLVRKRMHNPILFLALLVSSVAASVAFDLQHTEWRYHRYPHLALFILALAYLPIDLFALSLSRLASDVLRLRRLALTSIAATAMVLVLVVARPGLITPVPYRSELDQMLDTYPPSTTVTVFSTGVPALASAYRHHVNWGSRFAHMWMMPAIFQNELGGLPPPAPFKRLSSGTLARLSALQRTQSAEDLNYWQPSIVIFERCHPANPCQGMGDHTFSMLPWMLQGKDFAAAFSHYEQRASPFPSYYDLYVRVR